MDDVATVMEALELIECLRRSMAAHCNEEALLMTVALDHLMKEEVWINWRVASKCSPAAEGIGTRPNGDDPSYSKGRPAFAGRE